MIRIEIVYAQPGRQTLLEITVIEGTTVAGAIEASALRSVHPELDWSTSPVGIFGRLVSFEHTLEDGDRIEIYRPLVADPKDSRHQRVARRRAERGESTRKMR